ncbi:MAG: hypothetical protein H6934_12435 [Burkholderiaceae bacterium]|nr:hypothetical protein [Burkholderiaceae bacterium]
MNRVFLLALVAPALLGCAPALAADNDLKALRDEIAQMKAHHANRLAELEARLAKAEKAASDAASSSRRAQESARRATDRPAAFNPGISAVLNGTYARLSRDPGSYSIGGFMPSGDEIGPPPRSFGLGESEIGLSANIDTLFRGQLTFALAPDGGGEVEEAYIQTLALGNGMKLTAGRFLSGLGYLNAQHAHTWDFTDAPLAYAAFFGGPLRNDGIQFKLVAPTDLLLEFGAELASGGPFPSTDRNRNGSGLGVVYAHIGGDLGNAHSWRAGVSLLQTSPSDRAYTEADASGADVTRSFSGRSRTWVIDGIWKWAPQGNATARSLTIQGEYFRRRETGTLGYETTGTQLSGDYASTQSGYYAQAVYRFMPRWRIGYRFDRLDAGTPAIGLVDSGMLAASDFASLGGRRPRRNTLMLDWSPTEFSRLRLQLARDRSRPDVIDNQLWLQYIVSLGAHGAHRF